MVSRLSGWGPGWGSGWVWVLFPWLTNAYAMPGAAQSITAAPDGTGTQILQEGDRYTITGGSLSQDGANLFHSFQQFGLTANEAATIFSGASVQNVLGRVTGGNASVINGQLQLLGNANLYLINPAGVLFGPSARLDLPASFTVTTADSVGFGDTAIRWLSSSGNANYADLVGIPQNFAFSLAQPGAIFNAGELTVPAGAALTLLGGTVTNTGTLAAPDGRITVTAVPGQNRVRLSQAGSLLSLDISPLEPNPSLPAPGIAAAPTLPELLTGGTLPGATGVVVNRDGTISLTSAPTRIALEPGTAVLGSGPSAPQTAPLPTPAQLQAAEINILGDRLALLAATLDASGPSGGTIRIGGQLPEVSPAPPASPALPTAQLTFIDAASQITANGGTGPTTPAAADVGDGGQIVIWANRAVRSLGSLEARGGTSGGTGGRIEIGSGQDLVVRGSLDAAAPAGAVGHLRAIAPTLTVAGNPPALPPLDDLWNFASDPSPSLGAAELAELLDSSSVLLEARNIALSNGGISVTAADPRSDDEQTAPSLTLRAQDNITLTDFQIEAVNLPLDLLLAADTDGNGDGAIALTTSRLNASGGDLILGGGADPRQAAAPTIQLTDTRLSTSGAGAIALAASGGSAATGAARSGIRLQRSQLTVLGSGNLGLTSGSDLDLGNSQLTIGTGTLGLMAPEIDLVNSALQGNGDLLLSPLVPRAIALGGQADSGIATLDLTAADLSSLQNGFRSIVIGSSSGSGSLVLSGHLTISDPLVLRAATIDTTGGTLAGIDDASLTLRAHQGITTGSILNPGRAIALTSRSGTIDTRGGSLDSHSHSGDGGEITLSAGLDLFTADLLSASTAGNGGDIRLFSRAGSIQAGHWNSSGSLGGGNILAIAPNQIRVRSIDSSASLGTGGAIALRTSTAPGPAPNNRPAAVAPVASSSPLNISTDSLNSSGARGGGSITVEAQEQVRVAHVNSSGGDGVGGAIALTSLNASLLAGNLESWGGSGGGPITLTALTQMQLGQLNSSAHQGNGGNVTLTPQQSLILDFINAQGGTAGRGGDVQVHTRRFFRALSSFTDQNNVRSSISTAGRTGGGSILIQRGGNPNIPFLVGSATQNGTAEAVTTGSDTIRQQGFRYNTNQGRIRIRTGQDRIVEPEDRTDPTAQADSEATPAPSPAARPSPAPPRNSGGVVNPTTPPAQTVALNNQEFTTLESNLSQEFAGHLGAAALGVEGAPESTSLESAAQILSRLQNTVPDLRPALLYIQFVPVAIAPDAASSSQIAQDQEQIEVVLVTATGQPIRKRLPDVTRAQVRQTVRQLIREVTDLRKVRTTSYLPAAQQLYNWLIAPVAEELQARQVDNIGFILGDGLRSVPLAVLHDGRQFLIERYSLGLLPALNLTDTRYQDIRDARVLAMGASQFTDQAPLPAVPVELATITQELWRGSSFLNQSFTPEILINQRRDQPFRIVHLATHGAFRPGRPTNSYIQFWDQRLSLDRLRQLRLSDPPVSLLVLSACRTAVGDSQAELGFAGFALQAGVQSALASLWNVSDEGTLALMTEFYRELRQVPIKSEALRRAQIALLRGEVNQQGETLVRTGGGTIRLPVDLKARGDRTFNHPYFWSSFTLVGSPW